MKGVWLRIKTTLPQFTCTSCGLAYEDDDGEDVGAVQPANTVQAQRQNAVDPLRVKVTLKDHRCDLMTPKV